MPSDLFNQNTGSNQAIATYSPNWAVPLGGFTIPTGNLGQFRSNTSGFNLARWTGTTPSGDHEAIVTFTTSWNASGDYAGGAIGLSSVAVDGYALIASKTDYFVGKFTAGSEADIGSGTWTLALAVGDRIKISKTVSGGTVTLKVWKALAATPTIFVQDGSDVVDSSSAYTAGTYGIFGNENGSSGNYGGPWDGNDLGGGGGGGHTRVGAQFVNYGQMAAFGATGQGPY